MTAKEELLRDVLDLDEAKAARARIVVTDEPEPEPETVPLPEGWDRMANGEPMPDVAAAVRRSREGHQRHARHRRGADRLGFVKTPEEL
jgi:hypothetical protein